MGCRSGVRPGDRHPSSVALGASSPRWPGSTSRISSAVLSPAPHAPRAASQGGRMASIDKRPNGKWRARYRVHPGGPQRSNHFDRKTDAERFLTRIQGRSSTAPTSIQRLVGSRSATTRTRGGTRRCTADRPSSRSTRTSATTCSRRSVIVRSPDPTERGAGLGSGAHRGARTRNGRDRLPDLLRDPQRCGARPSHRPQPGEEHPAPQVALER